MTTPGPGRPRWDIPVFDPAGSIRRVTRPAGGPSQDPWWARCCVAPSRASRSAGPRGGAEVVWPSGHKSVEPTWVPVKSFLSKCRWMSVNVIYRTDTRSRSHEHMPRIAHRRRSRPPCLEAIATTGYHDARC
jgi:hypothetical protein